MKDVAPELYENILNEFEKESAAVVDVLQKKLEKGTATGEEISDYAARLGRIAEKVLIKNLTAEKLPDGRIYWNILERTIKPLTVHVCSMVQDAACEAKAAEYETLGIHIKPQRAGANEERIKAVMEKIMVEASDGH